MMLLYNLLAIFLLYTLSLASPSRTSNRASAKVGDEASMLYERVVNEALQNHRNLLTQTYADLRALGQARVEILEKAAELALKQHPVSPDFYKLRLIGTKDAWLDTRAYYNAAQKFDRMYQPVDSTKREIAAHARLMNEAGYPLKAMEANRLHAALLLADQWAEHPVDEDAQQQMEAVESFRPPLKGQERGAQQARSYSWRAKELKTSLTSLRFSR